LAELENLMIEQGSLQVREGRTRQWANALMSGTATDSYETELHDDTNNLFTSDMVGKTVYNITDGSSGTIYAYDDEGKVRAELTGGDGNFWDTGDVYSLSERIVALHRFYGENAQTGVDIKEFYAAIGNKIKYWDGDSWEDFELPPGITLHDADTYPGRFRQLKDRTIYSNGIDPVLMIKKETTQLFVAGIPDPDAELVISDCEDLDKWDIDTTDVSNASYKNLSLDAGFDRHTKGDYGIGLSCSESGKYVYATLTLDSALDLEWFAKINEGTADAGGSDVLLVRKSGSSFTAGLVGQQIKNTTDGSKAIITNYVDGDNIWHTPLEGGTNDSWTEDDDFVIGEPSSLNDYIAIDIFRYTKIDIDQCVLELSSVANFAKGFRCTIYTDTEFKHWTLKQKTMLAQWAMNPYNNKLFFGRFRKKWFVDMTHEVNGTHTGGAETNTLIDSNASFTSDLVGRAVKQDSDDYYGTVTAFVNSTTLTVQLYEEADPPVTKDWANGKNYIIYQQDDWSAIKYVRIKLMQNAESYTDKPARITFDNIRLLKTPPLPAEKFLQIATCDPSEIWQFAADDLIHSTEGIGCKKLTGVGVLHWPGTKDLSQYNEGTAIGGGDEIVFDVGGEAGTVASEFGFTMRLIDSSNVTAFGVFTLFNDFANAQQRSLPKQDFYYDGDFDWTSVKAMIITDNTFASACYIDNIRIQPPAVSKLINSFIPLDLVFADAAQEALDGLVTHFLGENPVVDKLTDMWFQSYANFTRKASGQGQLVYPEYKHGRYKFGDYALPSMQIQAEPGGAFGVIIKQGTDLTEYEDARFNLDAFLHPRQYDDSIFGFTWTEIPATPSDEFEIWVSTPDVEAIQKIIFRFYLNKNIGWSASKSGTQDTAGTNHTLYDADVSFTLTDIGKRIRNTTTNKWGIITWVGDATHKLIAWNDEGRLMWTLNNAYEIEGWSVAGDIAIDTDNYYEYVFDVQTLYMKLEGVAKGIKNITEYPGGNADNIELAREFYKESGLSVPIRAEAKGSDIGKYSNIPGGFGREGAWGSGDDENWWQVLIKWKRSDMIPHLQAEFETTQSMQNIAAHAITVVARDKRATVNFQDWRMTKKGAVKGEVMYKVKLEDEMGYLGPASDASKHLSVDGHEVNVTDIYIPHDTRIIRKRLYRTDSTGTFRHLDTIDRLESTYEDNIPEELLGDTIEEDVWKPPKAKYIEVIDNRMAYFNFTDRNNRVRHSRCQLSMPFAPHQCMDKDVFDILPDDGQEMRGIKSYMGHLIVLKDKSYYSVDPQSFERAVRSSERGLLAPESLVPIPGVGFGWLSHDGVCFGDHTSLDDETGLEIWDDIKDYSLAVKRQAVAFYYNKYYVLFIGTNNEHGYACYMPWKKWFYISNWNVWSVSRWEGKDDSSEIYAGDKDGYVNRLFYGDDDQGTAIASALRTLDYDLGLPDRDKYGKYLVYSAKNLVSGAGNVATLTFTPYIDQIAKTALTAVELDATTYKRKILKGRVDPKDYGNLVGYRLVGSKRYALRDIMLVPGLHSFNPNVQAV